MAETRRSRSRDFGGRSASAARRRRIPSLSAAPLHHRTSPAGRGIRLRVGLVPDGLAPGTAATRCPPLPGRVGSLETGDPIGAEFALHIVPALGVNPVSKAKAVPIPIRGWNEGMSLARDVLLKGIEALLPTVLSFVPNPSWQGPQAGDPRLVQYPTPVEASLRLRPATKGEPILVHVTLRNARVSSLIDVPLEGGEPLLPQVDERIPSPARKCCEARSSITAEFALAVQISLMGDPSAETVASFSVGYRNSGVPLPIDIPLKGGESLLPAIVVLVPYPASNTTEARGVFAAEVASTVRGPLRLDPLSEAEAVLIPIRAGNAGMSLPHYVPLEGRKPLLPPGFVLAPCPAGQSPEACDPVRR